MNTVSPSPFQRTLKRTPLILLLAALGAGAGAFIGHGQPDLFVSKAVVSVDQGRDYSFTLRGRSFLTSRELLDQLAEEVVETGEGEHFQIQANTASGLMTLTFSSPDAAVPETRVKEVYGYLTNELTRLCTEKTRALFESTDQKLQEAEKSGSSSHLLKALEEERAMAELELEKSTPVFTVLVAPEPAQLSTSVQRPTSFILAGGLLGLLAGMLIALASARR